MRRSQVLVICSHPITEQASGHTFVWPMCVGCIERTLFACVSPSAHAVFFFLYLRWLVWECFEQTTAMSSQDEQSRRVVLVRKKPVAGRIWKSLMWDVCIETHKLLQHWFAWQILCGTTYFLQASISTCSKCGVISRHITTRVFSLFYSSGLSALCCLFKPEWFVYAAWKVVDWFWRWCLELELLLVV